MPVTPPTVPPQTPGAAPLRLSLPGGMSIAGVPTFVGAGSLTQALALVAAAGPAMAPLAPAFAIIDAVLAVKDFAQAVPEMLVNPGALVEAIGKLLAKISRLASLIPQLSIPLTIIGVIDALIALLAGIAQELGAIAAQEARIASASSMAASLPPTARDALLTVCASSSAAIAVQRADLATTLTGADPLLGIVNAFAGLIGVPGVSLEIDITSGGTAAAVSSLNTAINVLRQFRRAIPI